MLNLVVGFIIGQFFGFCACALSFGGIIID